MLAVKVTWKWRKEGSNKWLKEFKKGSDCESEYEAARMNLHINKGKSRHLLKMKEQLLFESEFLRLLITTTLGRHYILLKNEKNRLHVQLHEQELVKLVSNNEVRSLAPGTEYE